MMKNWELARYFIDAKKCIDSLLYIELHWSELSHLEIREQITLRRDQFYIRCCVILDKAFPKTKDKQSICNEDDIIRSLYYERDKNSAHKDETYQAKHFSISEIITEMKLQLNCVKEKCGAVLPPELTINYVPHDKVLFRLLNGLKSSDVEELLKARKFTHYGKMPDGIPKKEVRIFHDTEDLRSIDEEDKAKYGVLCEAGLNTYEGIQNRQDFCIKVNTLYDLNMWATFNTESLAVLETLRREGYIDIFDQLHPVSHPQKTHRLKQILDEIHHCKED